MGFALTVFFFYHLSMQASDLTTNEKCRISDFTVWYEKELAKKKKSLRLK